MDRTGYLANQFLEMNHSLELQFRIPNEIQENLPLLWPLFHFIPPSALAGRHKACACAIIVLRGPRFARQTSFIY